MLAPALTLLLVALAAVVGELVEALTAGGLAPVSAFILTTFWILALGAMIDLSRLAGKHPRQPDVVNVGADCATLIIHIAGLAWAAYLLWGIS